MPRFEETKPLPWTGKGSRTAAARNEATKETAMTNETSLWDLLLGILGIGTETAEDEVGIEFVPAG